MRLRLFVSQDKIEDFQLHRRKVYPNANAVEDAEIIIENLPATAEDTNDKEPEEELTEINNQIKYHHFPTSAQQELLFERHQSNATPPSAKTDKQ